MNTSVAQDRPQLETDPSGNVYMAYRSAGAVTSGFATGSNDIVVAKFDTNGNRLWVRQDNTINTTTDDGNTERGPRIAVNSAGEVYLSYIVGFTGVISGGTLTSNIDAVLIKLNSSGVRQWAVQNNTLNTSGGNSPSALCLDPSGNVYIITTPPSTVQGGAFNGPQYSTTDRLG